MATAQELYDAVDQAILDLLAGYERVEVYSRTYVKSDLDQLRRMRADLKTELDQEAGGGPRVRQVVPRG